jgi:hypothetical protein
MKTYHWCLTFIWFSCTSYNSNQTTYLSQNVDFLITKGNEYWDKRSEPENAYWANSFLSKAHQLRPEDVETGLLFSQSCFYIGKYIEKNDNKKDSLFLKGTVTAMSIVLNISPNDINSKSILHPRESQNHLIEKIEYSEKSSLPALYLWALNFGEYIFSKPVRNRMKQKELLEVLFNTIYKWDPTYDFGGPIRILGILHSRLPGMNVKKGKDYFNRAIELFPNCLSHRISLAEYYYMKSGYREAFHDELNLVLKIDPTQIPDIMPENLMEQERAKLLLKRESFLFE